MSLNFYADPALTLRLNSLAPKRFLFPNKGGLKTSIVWLGDPYVSTCSIRANPGDTTLSLSDTGEFMNAAAIAATSGHIATAVADGQIIQYTGKTQGQLTGVSGITSPILIGSVVYPDVVYNGINGANVEVYPTGPDLLTYSINVAVGNTSTLSFPGLPAIFSQTSIAIGVVNALPVYVSVKMPTGTNQEFTNFGIACNGLYKRDIVDFTSYGSTEFAYGPTGDFYAYRHDEDIQLPIRILPVNREVFANSPGFIIGQYRWRGASNSNATSLVPTQWDIDSKAVGIEKFIAGYGDDGDLQPIQLIQSGDSVHMQVSRGEYFTGPNRYYLSEESNLEFRQSDISSANLDGTVTIKLQHTPREQAPIFVGTYLLDSQNFYETFLEYKYEPTLTNPDGTARTDLPSLYFTIDRATATITLNKYMPPVLAYLGSVSGLPIDYFNLRIYPIDSIQQIYVNRGPTAPFLFASGWTYNEETGSLLVPSIPYALSGQPMFAVCTPAVAILYDTGTDNARIIDTVDFNPAFSGLASGYFYLQHTIQSPTSLVLSCDKPEIAIPATQKSIIGLVAFGPIHFTNDYALLSVTAYGPIANEVIPNARLDVIVDPFTFTGTINYQNPLTQTVSVITGGDGTANLIFIPAGGFGTYIPTIPAVGMLGGVATTSITHDTLVLPAGIPLSQLWNPQEGWLVTTYAVMDNDPLFGMVGGNPALGQIVWKTSGIPGTTSYKTNGEINAWRTGNISVGALILPINAFDSAGHSYTTAAFDGNVKKLVYAQSLPSQSIVGAYFITFVQRVLIRMQLENSDVFSNYVLLQMAMPGLIVDNPWLILNDSIQGRLNVFRLGYVPPTI